MSEVVRAPAKLTLNLRVVGRRADGMHTIDAEMVSLDLADELWIGASERTQLRVEGPAPVISRIRAALEEKTR